MKNRNSRRAAGIGAGAFAAAALSEDEFRNAFRVVPVGEIAEIRESFYAISRERRIKHPAVAVVLSAAAAA